MPEKPFNVDEFIATVNRNKELILPSDGKKPVVKKEGKSEDLVSVDKVADDYFKNNKKVENVFLNQITECFDVINDKNVNEMIDQLEELLNLYPQLEDGLKERLDQSILKARKSHLISKSLLLEEIKYHFFE